MQGLVVSKERSHAGGVVIFREDGITYHLNL